MLNNVAPVDYNLVLPIILLGVHLVFHVLIIKIHHGDRDCIIKWDSVFFITFFHKRRSLLQFLTGHSKIKNEEGLVCKGPMKEFSYCGSNSGNQ